MDALTKRTAPRRAAALVRAYTTDGPMFASAAADNTNAFSYNTFAAAEAERRRLQAMQARGNMIYNMAVNAMATACGAVTDGASTAMVIANKVLLGAIAGLSQRK